MSLDREYHREGRGCVRTRRQRATAIYRETESAMVIGESSRANRLVGLLLLREERKIEALMGSVGLVVEEKNMRRWRGRL